MVRFVRVGCWSALVLVAAGCGGDGVKRLATVPAKGTITIDGKPYGPGTISFLPQSGDPEKRKAAVAQADANGNFTVKSYGDQDGAVPGEYLITLTGELGKAPPPATESAKIKIGDKGEEKLQIALKSTGGAGALLSPTLNNNKGAGTSLAPRK